MSKALDGLIQYRPNKQKFPIIVSQDCGHQVLNNDNVTTCASLTMALLTSKMEESLNFESKTVNLASSVLCFFLVFQTIWRNELIGKN